APEYADLCGAVAFLGAILLPVNWRLNPEEIAYVLNDGAPKILVVDAEDQPRVAAMTGSLGLIAGYYRNRANAPPFRSFAELAQSSAPLPATDVDADQGYVIIHTAAVDGRPRGALISQSGLIAASTQQLREWQLDARDVALVAVPLFHVTGLGLVLTMQLAGGVSVVPARFDPVDAARQIAAEKVTLFAEFAPMLLNLMDKAAETGASLASLRTVAGLDTAETIGRFEKTCPDARFWALY